MQSAEQNRRSVVYLRHTKHISMNWSNTNPMKPHKSRRSRVSKNKTNVQTHKWCHTIQSKAVEFAFARNNSIPKCQPRFVTEEGGWAPELFLGTTISNWKATNQVETQHSPTPFPFCCVTPPPGEQLTSFCDFQLKNKINKPLPRTCKIDHAREWYAEQWGVVGSKTF